MRTQCDQQSFGLHALRPAATRFCGTAWCAIVVRPNGAATCQHRATPWGPEHNRVGALKGRDSQGLDMPQLVSMNLVHLFNSMDGTFGVDGCGALAGLFRIARRSPRAMPWPGGHGGLLPHGSHRSVRACSYAYGLWCFSEVKLICGDCFANSPLSVVVSLTRGSPQGAFAVRELALLESGTQDSLTAGAMALENAAMPLRR